MLDVNRKYGGKVRIRVCGLCVEADKLLLVMHRGLGSEGRLLIPPGGGVEYGEDMKSALEREFREETGLEVSAGDLCFVHEFIEPPLHAVELFFSVTRTGGHLTTGQDPEYSEQEQLITHVSFYSKEELTAWPNAQLHAMIRYCTDPVGIKQLRGYFNFGDISLK